MSNLQSHLCIEQEINEIFESILRDLEPLVTNNYCNNADGLGFLANDDYEALEQAILGSIKPVDAVWLKKIIDNKVSKYLEIGSYLGVSFRIINKLFNPKFSFSVDPNIPHRVFYKPRNIFHEINKKIKYDFKDAFWCGGGEPTINSSYFIEKQINFDLIFIDADHSFECVSRDFFECLKILNKNGTVLLHDVQSWEGVNRFVKSLNPKNFSITYSLKGLDGFCSIKIN